jgi:hypothetical protein
MHPKRLREAMAPTRLLGALLIPFIVVPFQVTFQSMKMAIGYSAGFPWDARLIQADEALHGGPAWHLVSKIYDYPSVLEAGFYIYQSGWVLVGFLVLVWIAWHPDRRFREQVLLSNFLVWIIAGTVAAYLFASAGPCYVDAPQYQEVTQRLDAAGLVLVQWQRNHWYAQVNQIWHPFGGVSAFPSLHIAIASLIAFAIGSRSRLGGWLFGAFAVWIEIWSVILNWHYAIDGYGGALLAAICWIWAGRLTTAPVVYRASHEEQAHVPVSTEGPSQVCVVSTPPQLS